MDTLKKIKAMEQPIELWLKKNDYNFIECNYVPAHLFTSNPKVNALIRAFFRLSPINFRWLKKQKKFPATPQATVALLKAYNLVNKSDDIVTFLYKRALRLKSPKVKNFALKQGIHIAVNLYENSSEEPTPLNTVWFGEFLLEDWRNIIDEKQKKKLLLSITNYLVEELGYVDYKEQGVYFYYGPTLKKEIYNASAIISSFLLKVGSKYSDNNLLSLGRRGLDFIVNRQNADGSWFYAAPPERPAIDCFHQSYILKALIDSKNLYGKDIQDVIVHGMSYYKTFFQWDCKGQVVPRRYDKRYLPINTWLFVKVDGRDVAEAIIFFSEYMNDSKMLRGLIDYAYNVFYNKDMGHMYPEIFIYGKNRIPYIEFQAWFLYSLKVAKRNLMEE